MATIESDAQFRPTYEMLLTALCQTGLASAWGWSRPVADLKAARNSVVTWAAAFGNPEIQPLVTKLRRYVIRNRLTKPLVPLICRGGRLDNVLHITASTTGLVDRLSGKDVLVWDAGKGSRMAGLLRPGQPKGDLLVAHGHLLGHFASGAGKHMVDILSELNGNWDYVAFVASDQVLCLSEPARRELAALLDAAAAQDSDVIFFDGPPALSLCRLRFFLSSAQLPRKDGVMALARDRLLLKEYGGAHIFQCVLLKRRLMPVLAAVLESILELARTGYDVDYGVKDIAVLPRLIRANWLKKERNPVARKVHTALCELRDGTRHVRPVSMPLQAFNVNIPSVLNHLKTRIKCEPSCGG